jgi:hypothetical protein
MLPTNFAAPSARPGPAKEKVDAARASIKAFVVVERGFFIPHILFFVFDGFIPKTIINLFPKKAVFSPSEEIVMDNMSIGGNPTTKRFLHGNV